MPKQSSDDLDHTDELPVLLEAAFLDEPATRLAPHDDTGEHTTLLRAPRKPDTEPTAALRTELAVRAARIEELEAQNTRLLDRRGELERLLEAKEAAIGELNRALAHRREPDTSAIDRLSAQLAERESRLAELAASHERLRAQTEARDATIGDLRTTLAVQERNARELETQLAARPPRGDDAAIDDLREENAALAAYIAGRRAWWDETQAAQGTLALRVVALERDLATAATRLARADDLAARESMRAGELRASLVEHARRLETAERELRLARNAPTVLPAPTPSAPPPPVAVNPVAPPADPPEDTGSAAETAAAASFEVIAQLEGEVEFKRQQVGAQMVELRDRELRLRALNTETDALRQELAGARAELERGRTDIAKLERVVAEKDRALEARDTRIVTLQEELGQRLGALQKRNALDLSLQSLESRSERTRTGDAALEGGQSPALICLTGEAPKQFPLSKSKIVVGRGAHCDLQILTHFVSREHARISLAGSRVLIEDLGSRNGVFVNSIRVDRQDLQHGDLVTIGETQFRFVESLAH